jgi:dTDP-4-amino-4,6-dideoxygalactose transaminase
VLESSLWRGGVGEPGPWEREFEERFSRKHGCTYSSLVSNGTFALYAALVSLGIGVWVSLGLILLIKPFSLGFKALRIPFSPGSISLGSTRSG